MRMGKRCRTGFRRCGILAAPQHRSAQHSDIRHQLSFGAKRRTDAFAGSISADGEYTGSSLRSDVMKTKKGVPPRVEYVLEAQALKEARDDPRRRRSSPEILLHDGAGSKREDDPSRAGDERQAGAAQVFSEARRQQVRLRATLVRQR